MDKIDAKTVLGAVVLVGAGKVVAGEPVADNYAVHAKPGSALAAMPGEEVLKVLRAAYPRCVFTWCAKAAPVEEKPEKAAK
jgi:hypothetical protein